MNEKAVETVPSDSHKKMIEVVRKTIFPGADDAELALFIHKCTQVGVSPLDKALIPIKFRNPDGTFTISFIVTIDLLRSRSEDSGQYNGIDEPEFEGDIQQEVDGKPPITVPELCRVKVYRKGIDRPFVGVARWKEYYPGQGKGHKWRQMPTLMLSKCAEALARRLAFPQQLNKLYTAEEMEMASTAISGTQTIKQQIGAPTAQGQTQDDSSFKEPDDETRKANRWISTAQEKRIYACCKAKNVDPETVKTWYKLHKRNEAAHLCHVTWSKGRGETMSEYDKLIETIEKDPGFFKKYGPAGTAAKAPASPPVAAPSQDTGSAVTPTPREVFEIQVAEMVEAAGLGTERIDAEVKNAGFKTLSEVPEANFEGFLRQLRETL